MAITLAQVPTYPAPGRRVRVTPTAGAGGNYARLWLTDAPLGSEWRSKIATAAASRLDLAECDSGKAFDFLPDVGGVYVVTAQEYTKGASTYGGTYADDLAGYTSETKVGSEATLYLYVGQRLEQSLGAGADTAKLAVWVWNDTVRRTTIAEHGEATPAVYAPSSDRARTAVLSSAVATALTDLVNQTASTSLGTVSSVLDDIAQKIAAHMVTGATTHNAADSDNDDKIGRVLDNASAAEGVVYAAQTIATALSRHMRNDNAGAGTGTAASAYHQVSTPKADWANLPAFQACGDIGQAFAVIGAIWDAYEAHRVSVAVHGTADSTNTLTSLPRLFAVHKAFAAAVRASNPTAPASINSAVTLLAHSAGFHEVTATANAAGTYVSAAEPSGGPGF